MRRFVAAGVWVLCLVIVPGISVAGEKKASPARPFQSGEKLTYTISWSNVFSAGTAVMEVKQEKDADGRSIYRFVSTARTTGMVDKAYTVRDTVQSVVDGETLESVFYDLDQRHGSKKKKRRLTFDHAKKKVTSVADGAESVTDIPEHTQDALSSVYYVRTAPEFVVGKPVVVGIFDSGKYWAVEVHVLGRERLKTPVGEFNTIKVKTYPKYEGVFMHKGEIFMWLTDDHRRVPVLMKSTITIGSIVATLTEMKLGDESR
jgi:hypothetical protein